MSAFAPATLAFLALGIAGYAIVSYLTGSPLSAGFLMGKTHYQSFTPTPLWTAALVVHVAGGSLALLAGAYQWLSLRLPFRRRHPAAFRSAHLVSGVLYAAGVLTGGLAGVLMAPVAMGGVVAAWGFGLLDAAWLVTTAFAVVAGARLRRPGPGQDLVDLRLRHRRWMIRSYALTAAAITLRLYLPLFTVVLGLDFVASYVVIAWMCWVPNLVAAELWVRLRTVEA